MASEPVASPLAVTVILPTHNSAVYIEEQIASILGQDYPDVRVLVLDDGSDDGTPGILEAAFGDTGRVAVLRNEQPGGQNAAIEALLERVDTPLFAMSDHDDVWVPHKLTMTIAELLATSTDLCYSDLQVVSRDLEVVAESAFRFSGMPSVRGRRPLPILVKNPVHGCTVVGQRRLLETALPFPVGLPNHDRWLALVAASGRGVSCVDEPLVRYRQHDANAIGALPFSPEGLTKRVGGRGARALFAFAGHRLHERLVYLGALEDREHSSALLRAVRRYLGLPRIVRAALLPAYLGALAVGAREVPWRTKLVDAVLVVLAPPDRQPRAHRHRVVTLDEDALGVACRRLAADVEASGYRPTHIVAIASAGIHVARHMAGAFADAPAVLEIVARRPATRLKGTVGIRSILARAPRWLTTVVRHLEYRLITTRKRTGERTVAMAPEHLEALRCSSSVECRILVVDDCVDSGLSLEACLVHLRSELGPRVEMRSAVLAASLPDPTVRPEYCLYPHTTLRGPWSFDA